MFKPTSFLGMLYKAYLLFPSHPAKIRIQNIAGKLFFPSGIKLKNTEGVEFKLDANDWITRVLLEEGEYEPLSLQVAKRLVKKSGVFIDIGANFGLYSCLLGMENKKLEVYAVEPNYKIMPCLMENIERNKLRQQVQVINTAVGGSMQFVFLNQPEKNNIGTTSVSLVDNNGYSVLSSTLGYIMEAYNLNEACLIKIDIEGNEFSVFEQFPFDKYYIKNILLEFNALSKIDFKFLKFFFENKGFRLQTVDGKELIGIETPIPENNIWFVNRKMTVNE